MIQRSHIHILGGGLAGSLLALHMAELGHCVDVFEKRQDLRSGAAPAGRSINLAISARGIEALARVGLAEEIMAVTIPMRGRMIHNQDGSTALQPYSHNPDQFIRSVSRADLNRRLLAAAGRFDDVRLHFEVSGKSIDLNSRKITYVRPPATSRGRAASAEMTSFVREPDVIFGADGAGSVVREAMTRQAALSVDTSLLEHGYKELTIHPFPDGTARLPIEALHIWPRGGFMLIALPNLDNSFTCTLFMPHRGPDSFETLASADQIGVFLEQQFPDAYHLMDNPVDEYLENPVGCLGTIRCPVWHFRGNACLLGDAAHAVVPFFGQGMNCAFEDCTVLRNILNSGPDSWEAAFEAFSQARVPNTNAIADMALANFIEMRDHVNDPDFKLRREVGFELENLFPGRFIPKYSLVSFHTIPYTEAKIRGAVQEQILLELCLGKTTVSEIDFERGRDLVESRM